MEIQVFTCLEEFRPPSDLASSGELTLIKFPGKGLMEGETPETDEDPYFQTFPFVFMVEYVIIFNLRD